MTPDRSKAVSTCTAQCRGGARGDESSEETQLEMDTALTGLAAYRSTRTSPTAVTRAGGGGGDEERRGGREDRMLREHSFSLTEREDCGRIKIRICRQERGRGERGGERDGESRDRMVGMPAAEVKSWIKDREVEDWVLSR
jgi:hypothetical protein